MLLYYFWLLIAWCTDYIWKIGYAIGSEKGKTAPQGENGQQSVTAWAYPETQRLRKYAKAENNILPALFVLIVLYIRWD